MEVSHADLSEVTWMVLVDVGAVVVLATGHTTTTGMLPVLADTTVTGRDVTAAGRAYVSSCSNGWFRGHVVGCAGPVDAAAANDGVDWW